jgi:hypothetical protein
MTPWTSVLGHRYKDRTRKNCTFNDTVVGRDFEHLFNCINTFLCLSISVYNRIVIVFRGQCAAQFRVLILLGTGQFPSKIYTTFGAHMAEKNSHLDDQWPSKLRGDMAMLALVTRGYTSIQSIHRKSIAGWPSDPMFEPYGRHISGGHMEFGCSIQHLWNKETSNEDNHPVTKPIEVDVTIIVSSHLAS